MEVEVVRMRILGSGSVKGKIFLLLMGGTIAWEGVWDDDIYGV